VIAARYQEAGQLYTGGLAVTSYNDGGVVNQFVSDADKALVEQAAAATDDSGLALLAQQVRHGGWLSSTYNGAYSDVAANIGPNVAIAESLGIPIITYEGNTGFPIDDRSRWPSNDPKYGLVKDFFTRFYSYPPVRALLLESHRLYRSLGVTTNTIEADFGPIDGAYATIQDAYGAVVSLRGQAMVDFQANPGPTKLLSIDALTSDDVHQGDHLTKRITARGGFGKLDISVTGLAPGLSFDGFRTIEGQFSQQASQPNTVTVTATDQSIPPQTVSITFTQMVGAPRVYPSGRYMRVAVQEVANPGNRVFYCESDFIGIRAPNSTVDIAGTWSGDAQGQFPATNLSSVDGAYWVSNAMVNGLPDIRGDFGSLRTIAAVVFAPTNDANKAPARFQIYLSDVPFASDGSGGTLVLSINEPDITNWQSLPGGKRVFPLG
jgi:hypothetical protein